jgi:hypothetical protein
MRVGSDGNGGCAENGDGVEWVEEVLDGKAAFFTRSERLDFGTVEEALIPINEGWGRAGRQGRRIQGLAGFGLLGRLLDRRKSGSRCEKAGASGGKTFARRFGFGNYPAGAALGVLVLDDRQGSVRKWSGGVDGNRLARDTGWQQCNHHVNQGWEKQNEGCSVEPETVCGSNFNTSVPVISQRLVSSPVELFASRSVNLRDSDRYLY